MIDSLLKEYNSSNNNSTLDNYNLKELIDLYVTYSRPKYFKEHSNMEEILSYLSSYILNNLTKGSFLEIMDMYTKLMMMVIELEEQRESNDNIIRIRSNNLEDEFFLENESKSFGLEKEFFVQKYRKELDTFKEYGALYKKIVNLLDAFQKSVLSYLNEYVKELDESQQSNLLKTINERIEKNSIEILKRIELRQNKKKIELQSRFNEIPISKIYEQLDTSYLTKQNYVYKNFQAILEDLYKTNNK